jgi:hypothetical protein
VPPDQNSTSMCAAPRGQRYGQSLALQTRSMRTTRPGPCAGLAGHWTVAESLVSAGRHVDRRELGGVLGGDRGLGRPDTSYPDVALKDVGRSGQWSGTPGSIPFGCTSDC